MNNKNIELYDGKDSLDQEFFSQREIARQKYIAFNRAIDNRITFILKTITDIYNLNAVHWSYPADFGSEEELSGTFDENQDQEFICLDVDYYQKGRDPLQETTIKTKDGKFIRLFERLPYHWLFQDFKQELWDGKINYENHEAEKLKKREDNKRRKQFDRDLKKKTADENAAALNTILAKLTLEEIEILRRTK